MSEKLLRAAGEAAASWIEQALTDTGCGIPGGATANTDSPIEAQLLVAVAFYYRLWGEPLIVAQKASVLDMSFYEAAQDHAVLIVPQYSVGSYRADFAIFTRSHRSVKVIVECDGHMFHEKTKEQAQRDKARDRELQSRGFKVIRFTGSEIYNKPLEAAGEVLEIVQGAVQDAWLAQ